MAAQDIELRTIASSRASLVNDPDGEALAKHDQLHKIPRRRHACPLIALLGLFIHLVISGSGVAISVLVVYFNLKVVSSGAFDLVGRILLFMASCMGIFYVFMHAFAAREKYVRSHGSPQFFGYFTVAVAVLIMRLGVPVWTGSVVLTAYVAAMKGFDAVEGLQGNVIWIQLGIASLGLISLILMVVITETTERPFATSLFSKRSFLKADTIFSGRVHGFNLSVSRADRRSEREENDPAKTKGSTELDPKQTGFDRSTINTPETPDFPTAANPALISPTLGAKRPLFHMRSQRIPIPLESVFTSEDSQIDTQDSPRKLAWHPQRESMYATPQRPQLEIIAASANPRPPPTTLRQPSSVTSRESLSPHSVVQSHMISEHGNTKMASELDTTVPLSPALGTPIAIQNSAPLRIANPDEVPAQPEEEAPSLAKLLGQLSSRAAARRRNSLLMRQANLISRPADNNTRAGSRTDMAAVLFDQPSDYVRMTELDTAQNAQMARQADSDTKKTISVPYADETAVLSPGPGPSIEFVEIPRPAEIATQAMTVVQDERAFAVPQPMTGNTADPLMIRNFSRPAVPRPSTAGGEEDGLPFGGTSDGRGRGDVREDKSLARRSRSLPSTHQDRSIPASGENQVRRREANAGGRRKGSQPPAAPRFSPFPRAPVATPAVGLVKAKDLGQGSTTRLEDRIEKWRDGVPVGKG